MALRPHLSMGLPLSRDVIHYFIDFIYMIVLDTIHVNRIVVLRPC